MALIIFDIDGTLLQTDLVTVPAVQRTFAAYGLPAPDAEVICSFFGRPVQEYLDWLAAQCPADRMDEIVAATNALELKLIGAEGRLYPGVREVLETLRGEGHVLAICSNGPEDYVNEFVDTHHVRDFFAMIVMPGKVLDEVDAVDGVDKAPSKIAMVRRILDRVSERPAIVIGDRADDIAAARHNGALAIAASYGFGSTEELTAADAIVRSAPDLPAAISLLLA